MLYNHTVMTDIPSTLKNNVLSISNLSISIKQQGIEKEIIKNISIDVPKGETVALLGETGSGKSLVVYSVLDLLPKVAKISGGTINFNSSNLLTMPKKMLRSIKGQDIGIIFQEPVKALNPLMQIGKQIGETIAVHKKLGRKNVKEQVLSLMELVGIPDPARRYVQYPFQLSAGVNQRVVTAMALACRPQLLLADEPTSALDTTVQAQILDLLSRLIKDLSMSVLLISHDIKVVASIADKIAVLKEGFIIERGTTKEVLDSPFHPYTRNLISGMPEISRIAIEKTPSDKGCPYATLCKEAMEICFKQNPEELILSETRRVRCFLYGGREQ
ncbi:MAG: ABC transporter ATP-binding protein [Deltaproteobacteria bacterium]|nr:ABC transporter ATP-binding protein [Deltaproteobacteria bacterium]